MRLIIPIVLIGAFLVAAVAWDRPSPRAELTSAYQSIETLDPQMMQAVDDIRLVYGMFEGLCTFDHLTFSVEPGVAKSWDLADDGVTYTFKLRDDAKWSDGTPVTAEDFRYAWRVGMMPDTSPPYIEFLFLIKGGHEFNAWCMEELKRIATITDPAKRMAAAQRRIEESVRRFDEMVGVKVVDDHTIIVTARQPTPYFLEIMACWPLFPLPRHVLEPTSAIDPSTLMLRRDQQWTKPGRGTMLTNGPYILKEWRFKRELLFVENPHYWNKQIVGPKSVRMVNFQTVDAMFKAYESGVIDIIFGAQALTYCPELIEQQKQGLRKDVHPETVYGTYYFVYNCRPTLPDGRANPFADPRVRLAFTMATNKQDLVEKVTRLHQPTADVFIPPGAIEGYESPRGVGYDPQRARELLAEAGYPGGVGLPTIEISYNTSGGHDLVSQALGKMWQDELGVSVSYDSQEWKVFLDRRSRGQFMIARSGWGGDYLDPTTFLDLFRTGNGHNDGGYEDPQYDALLDKAAAAARNPQERMSLLGQAEARVMDETMPMLPLYHYTYVNLHDPEELTDVSEHPRQIQMFHRMRLLK